MRLLLLCMALALAAPAAARAGTLDGEWVREDGKRYWIFSGAGVLLEPGEFGCRFRCSRQGENDLVLSLTFTRTSDERGFFRTKAVIPGAQAATVGKGFAGKWEWVDLDERGAIAARGEEEHVLTKARDLTADEMRRATALVRAQVAADDYLDPSSETYDPAKALQEIDFALSSPWLGTDDGGLRKRRAAIEALTKRRRAG